MYQYGDYHVLLTFFYQNCCCCYVDGCCYGCYGFCCTVHTPLLFRCACYFVCFSYNLRGAITKSNASRDPLTYTPTAPPTPLPFTPHLTPLPAQRFTPCPGPSLQILMQRGVQCNNCLEKSDFVKRVKDTEHLDL